MARKFWVYLRMIPTSLLTALSCHLTCYGCSLFTANFGDVFEGRHPRAKPSTVRLLKKKMKLEVCK